MTATLMNLENGRAAKCRIEVPGYSACYAPHGELMKWARKTGCARRLHKLWHGENMEPFIAVKGETMLGFAVYRNPPEWYERRGKWEHYHKSTAMQEDELAFFAAETTT